MISWFSKGNNDGEGTSKEGKVRETIVDDMQEQKASVSTDPADLNASDCDFQYFTDGEGDEMTRKKMEKDELVTTRFAHSELPFDIMVFLSTYFPLCSPPVCLSVLLEPLFIAPQGVTNK